MVGDARARLDHKERQAAGLAASELQGTLSVESALLLPILRTPKSTPVQ